MALGLQPSVLDLSFVLGYADSTSLKFRFSAYSRINTVSLVDVTVLFSVGYKNPKNFLLPSSPSFFTWQHWVAFEWLNCRLKITEIKS